MENTRGEAAVGLDRVACWQAVVERDASADGRFVYAVRTTGVFCRPSCGARRPREQNVAFYATAMAARSAGFRACKRCCPESSPASRHVDSIALACRLIESSEQAPSLRDLAQHAGLAPHYFQRTFKAITGVSPKAYAQRVRTTRLEGALVRAARITDACYDAGYGSSGRFYESATGILGMTPRQYRDGANGLALHFALARCSLGAILVAATDRGVCAILLGDEPEALLRELHERFPRAELRGGEAGFERLVARVIALVEQPGAGHDLPLDIRGTAFQQKVWAALRGVPAGRTATYTEIARRVGSPNAIRAVAAACAANPLAVAVPCHRVVRLDGNLAGYRWGLARKQELLERERKDAGTVGKSGLGPSRDGAVPETASRRRSRGTTGQA